MKTSSDDQDLLLDLLNTMPVTHGEPHDALRDQEAAAAWTRDRGGVGTPAEVTTVRAVRDHLQAVARGEEAPQVLAPFVRGSSRLPTMEGGALQWQLHAPATELLAARAVIAWSELEQEHPGRLRACGNPECRLFLIDRSHANRAQWCSMSTCGNRMKARRHYRRRREAAGGAD
ncbi:CGNR zinc finger domain-containing protein [Brachybacterium sacelli]|uniref:RNA-binding Zn ribbon-like protein n=1 Tax=Brachybacterium sacelli TaxID=173364 RepID=A0ABS4WWP4_9MICO|nr:CGNR zinc finger domain-containing protein [Brachybacterium sacelli]MBP2380632.1 putative RNA-binding Zn ribbon-like protein [Brachybacterium sacelli]